jgi:hypothetical protein
MYNNAVGRLEYHAVLQEHLIFFEFMFFDFQNQVFTIIQAILFSQKGIIHSSIITPTAILSEFGSIAKNIPAGLTLTLPLAHNNVFG